MSELKQDEKGNEASVFITERGRGKRKIRVQPIKKDDELEKEISVLALTIRWGK